jgi:hypothetical protein
MSAGFGGRGRVIGIVVWALLAAAVTSSARADSVNIHIDQAHLLKLPDQVATIVIGNPLIADATLQSGGLLVVTGKGYGATNLLALDRNGRVIMSKTVRVVGPANGDLVVVYRGVDRESYSCAPQCQPRITLGDSKSFFTDTLAQTGARTGQAQAKDNVAPAAPSAPTPR